MKKFKLSRGKAYKNESGKIQIRVLRLEHGKPVKGNVSRSFCVLNATVTDVFAAIQRALLVTLVGVPLLFSLPAHAASWTYTFEDAVPHLVAQQIHLVSGNGITLYFGPGWRRGVDEDTCVPPNGCNIPSCPPTCVDLGPWGDTANEPSGNCTGYTLDTIDDSTSIYITPPILYLSFRYSGRGYEYCDEGGCSQGFNSLPMRVDAFVPEGYYPPVAVVYFNEPGDDWETGCSGDPGGTQCSWPTASLTFSQPVGIVRLGHNLQGIIQFYVDDITVNTEVPPHPQYAPRVVGLYR